MRNTDYARTLSQGKSFEYSTWQEFVKYSNDCFKQDFVSFNNALFACKKTHISAADTRPNREGVSDYWELVTAGFTGDKGDKGDKGEDGITPLIKIEDKYWFISYDKGVTWINMGSVEKTAGWEWGEY